MESSNPLSPAQPNGAADLTGDSHRIDIICPEPSLVSCSQEHEKSSIYTEDSELPRSSEYDADDEQLENTDEDDRKYTKTEKNALSSQWLLSNPPDLEMPKSETWVGGNCILGNDQNGKDIAELERMEQRLDEVPRVNKLPLPKIVCDDKFSCDKPYPSNNFMSLNGRINESNKESLCEVHSKETNGNFEFTKVNDVVRSIIEELFEISTKNQYESHAQISEMIAKKPHIMLHTDEFYGKECPLEPFKESVVVNNKKDSNDKNIQIYTTVADGLDNIAAFSVGKLNMEDNFTDDSVQNSWVTAKTNVELSDFEGTDQSSTFSQNSGSDFVGETIYFSSQESCHSETPIPSQHFRSDIYLDDDGYFRSKVKTKTKSPPLFPALSRPAVESRNPLPSWVVAYEIIEDILDNLTPIQDSYVSDEHNITDNNETDMTSQSFVTGVDSREKFMIDPCAGECLVPEEEKESFRSALSHVKDAECQLSDECAMEITDDSVTESKIVVTECELASAASSSPCGRSRELQDVLPKISVENEGPHSESVKSAEKEAAEDLNFSKVPYIEEDFNLDIKALYQHTPERQKVCSPILNAAQVEKYCFPSFPYHLLLQEDFTLELDDLNYSSSENSFIYACNILDEDDLAQFSFPSFPKHLLLQEHGTGFNMDSDYNKDTEEDECDEAFMGSDVDSVNNHTCESEHVFFIYDLVDCIIDNVIRNNDKDVIIDEVTEDLIDNAIGASLVADSILTEILEMVVPDELPFVVLETTSIDREVFQSMKRAPPPDSPGLPAKKQLNLILPKIEYQTSEEYSIKEEPLDLPEVPQDFDDYPDIKPDLPSPEEFLAARLLAKELASKSKKKSSRKGRKGQANSRTPPTRRGVSPPPATRKQPKRQPALKTNLLGESKKAPTRSQKPQPPPPPPPKVEVAKKHSARNLKKEARPPSPSPLPKRRRAGEQLEVASHSRRRSSPPPVPASAQANRSASKRRAASPPLQAKRRASSPLHVNQAKTAPVKRRAVSPVPPVAKRRAALPSPRVTPIGRRRSSPPPPPPSISTFNKHSKIQPAVSARSTRSMPAFPDPAPELPKSSHSTRSRRLLPSDDDVPLQRRVIFSQPPVRPPARAVASPVAARKAQAVVVKNVAVKSTTTRPLPAAVTVARRKGMFHPMRTVSESPVDLHNEAGPSSAGYSRLRGLIELNDAKKMKLSPIGISIIPCSIRMVRSDFIERLLPSKKTDETTFCELCEPRRIFLSKKGFVQHLKTEHATTFGTSGPVVSPVVAGGRCPGCDKKYHSENRLITHIKICPAVVGKNKNVATTELADLASRGVEVTKKGSQVMESRPVEENLKYACDTCGIKFSLWSAVEAHKRCHWDNVVNDPLNLESESESSSSGNYESQMQRHGQGLKMTIRRQEKMIFRCDTCGAPFDKRETLKTHELSHKVRVKRERVSPDIEILEEYIAPRTYVAPPSSLAAAVAMYGPASPPPLWAVPSSQTSLSNSLLQPAAPAINSLPSRASTSLQQVPDPSSHASASLESTSYFQPVNPFENNSIMLLEDESEDENDAEIMSWTSLESKGTARKSTGGPAQARPSLPSLQKGVAIQTQSQVKPMSEGIVRPLPAYLQRGKVINQVKPMPKMTPRPGLTLIRLPRSAPQKPVAVPARFSAPQRPAAAPVMFPAQRPAAAPVMFLAPVEPSPSATIKKPRSQVPTARKSTAPPRKPLKRKHFSFHDDYQ